MAEAYWAESRRPLDSLVFLAPLLIIYEFGVLRLGVQNGADAFMRHGLDKLGFSQHFLLPALMVCILLGWHHLLHEPWRLTAGTISGMAAESILLAICLWLFSLAQIAMFASIPSPLSPATMSIGSKIKDSIGFLGAGIYEELLFRLILFSSVAWGLCKAGLNKKSAAILAAILVSLLFSSAHYRFMSKNGYPFDWFSFTFRFFAGIFFSVVFVYRGFGIAAGSHAAYNILVWMFHHA
jgi:membrane protease YdiL (CAAX protease family)